MKLFKILIRHCSPKDCEEAIHSWVIAADEPAVLAYVDKELAYGCWTDQHNDSLDEPLTIYDKDYNEIGTENYLERMLRVRGEFFDPDASFDDAYYGVTHYGWEEGLEITQEQKDTLVKLGILSRDLITNEVYQED